MNLPILTSEVRVWENTSARCLILDVWNLVQRFSTQTGTDDLFIFTFTADPPGSSAADRYTSFLPNFGYNDRFKTHFSSRQINTPHAASSIRRRSCSQAVDRSPNSPKSTNNPFHTNSYESTQILEFIFYIIAAAPLCIIYSPKVD